MRSVTRQLSSVSASMSFNLHPTRIGQPFRAKPLDLVLGHIMRRRGVWAATGTEIVDWYLKQLA